MADVHHRDLDLAFFAPLLARGVRDVFQPTGKLRAHKPLLDACLDGVTASLRAELPEYGRDLAIDASDLAAFANGQRYVSDGGPEPRVSRPTKTRRRLLWLQDPSGRLRGNGTARLVARRDSARPRSQLRLAATRRGTHDTGPIHDGFEQHGCRPIVPLKKTTAVKRGDHRAPICEHGTSTFAGADLKRGASKWRCPTGECKPASVWRKASRLHPLIPRESKRFGDLYRGRSAVEREFGRLKHEYGLGPLRVRGLEKVALHADLTMLARLSQALARARAVSLAA